MEGPPGRLSSTLALILEKIKDTVRLHFYRLLHKCFPSRCQPEYGPLGCLSSFQSKRGGGGVRVRSPSAGSSLPVGTADRPPESAGTARLETDNARNGRAATRGRRRESRPEEDEVPARGGCFVCTSHRSRQRERWGRPRRSPHRTIRAGKPFLPEERCPYSTSAGAITFGYVRQPRGIDLRTWSTSGSSASTGRGRASRKPLICWLRG